MLLNFSVDYLFSNSLSSIIILVRILTQLFVVWFLHVKR